MLPHSSTPKNLYGTIQGEQATGRKELVGDSWDIWSVCIRRPSNVTRIVRALQKTEGIYIFYLLVGVYVSATYTGQLVVMYASQVGINTSESGIALGLIP